MGVSFLIGQILLEFDNPQDTADVLAFLCGAAVNVTNGVKFDWDSFLNALKEHRED